MSWGVLFALCVAVGFALYQTVGGGPSPEVEKALDEGALLLDVRTPGEFRAGHGKGARNIPVDELAKRIDELGEPGPVVVYCRSGMRSRRAAALLAERGFQVVDARNQAGLPDAWKG